MPDLSPRWRKVVRDMLGNRTRTILVLLSITLGTQSVGFIAGAREIILRSLAESYASMNAASVTLLADPFDEDVVRAARGLTSIREADGRRLVTLRFSADAGEWHDIDVFASPDFDQIRLNRLRPEAGAWPPPDRELLLERDSLKLAGLRIGQLVLIEMPDGEQHELRIAGTVHDLSQPSATVGGRIFGYLTPTTLQWLGERNPRDLNQLHLQVAEHENDEAHIGRVAVDVRDRLESGGVRVHRITIPQPGRMWVDDHIQSMLLLLGVLGGLSLFMSAFLVINTIAALLARQVREIGVMKAIGARTDQLVGMYLGMVLIYGALALVVAVPLGLAIALVDVAYTASLLNLDTVGFMISPTALWLQAAAALLLPAAAAFFPIFTGSRLTVREAISSQGLGGPSGRGLTDRLFGRLPWLTRPMLLASRNTFRRKGRVVLTLATLILGGAIFVSVLSVRDSLMVTLGESFGYRAYDLLLTFREPYGRRQLEREALRVPGVVEAEAWASRTAYRVRPDGSESDAITLLAPPAESELIRPVLLDGRWLEPGDRDVVVVNAEVVRDEPDLVVGGELRLKIAGQRSAWRVVGVVRGELSGPMAYANYAYLAATLNEVERAGQLQVVTEQHDPASQARVMRALEEHFKDLGFRLDSTMATTVHHASVSNGYNVIVVFLLAMAVQLALVGGLGLMGTMSINVLERTREIGVMRAIGASDGAVLRVVMVEGIILGLLSWAAGSVLAIPLSRLLSDAVGIGFTKSPLTFVFSGTGTLVWLALVIGIAALASFFPARNAARLTVRDVLAYE